MEILNEQHFFAGAFIARVFLGCLFLFQGYDAVFRIKIKNVIATYQNSFTNRGIPKSVTVLASWFTCYTELICGALLILGLYQYVALYLLGINLVVAAIGFGITTPMWDTRYVMPRLILLLLLLFIPSQYNAWSIDYLIFNH
jgi:putative oxidoreductase